MTTDLHTRLSRISHILSNGGTVATERVIDALDEAAALAAAPSTSPAAAAVAGEPVADEARRLAMEHGLAFEVVASGSQIEKLARLIAKVRAAPHPSPSAAEQADDTLRWRLSTIAAECDDPDTTDALDKLLEELPRGPGDGPIFAAAPSASPAEAPADALFAAIQHGDEVHREWLREAVHAWFDGKPVPPPRAAHPQPVAPAGQAAAGVQGELHCGPCESRCADCPIDWSRFPAPAVERGVAEEQERAFAEWLNDQRDKPVAEVFHDIVARYRAALSTAGKEQA